MKQIIFFLLSVFVFTNLKAQTSNGIIQGSIQSTKQESLPGITIQLADTKFGTFTDEDGYFQIRNLPPGNYTLIISGIGYKISKENIIVKAKEFTAIDLQLNETTKELMLVTVKAPLQKRYERTFSTAGTRLPLKLIETPQTIQVITNEVMKDQQAQNLNDVAKNMTGVINNNMYTSYTMRGFTNYYPNSFITFDGFVGNMYQWSQMVQLYNIDRVEMIAGPASALYSVGTPGGVMNMVTKRPMAEKMYSFNITTGSWNLIDVSADLTGPLTKNQKLLYRLNIGYNRANSFRAYQYNQNIVIAPSLTYNFTDKTNLSLDFINADNKTRFAYDRGGLVFMNADSTYNFKGALNKFVHNSPDDFSTINANNLTLRFNHQFSGNFKLTYMSRLIRTYFDMGEHYGVNYGDNYLTHLDTLRRNYDRWTYKPYNIQNSIFTTFTFGKEIFKQTLVTGIDYQRYGATQNKYIDDVAPSIAVASPDYSKDDFKSYPLPAQYQNDKNDTRQFGAYIQDLISIKYKFKILLAGRYENFLYVSKPLSKENWSQTNDSSKATVFLPRIGLVYNLNNNNSIYGSYCESFQPQYGNNRDAGGPFPPQKGKQFEIGYKALFFGGKLMSTIALYSIDYVNVLKTDPTDSTGQRQIAVPGLTIQGAEFTLQGKIKQFSIIGGYAYNHVIFSENSPLGPKGARYDNAPKHIANLWLKYSVAQNYKLKGFCVSIGGKYAGDRVGSAFNQHFLMPAYFLLDAAINYNVKNFNIGLNGYNLLDTKYVLGAYYSDLQVPMGTPMNWKLSVGYTIK